MGHNMQNYAECIQVKIIQPLISCHSQLLALGLLYCSLPKGHGWEALL